MGNDVARNTYAASLAILQNNGFTARTFLDIGAAEGGFFLARHGINLFPGARHFFVDAMAENEPAYKKMASLSNAGYAITALSCLEGSVNVRIDPTFYNTHITTVQAGTYATIRSVPVTTMDKLVATHSLQPPYAMKIDVQGAELDCLRGAVKTLAQSTAVVVENQLLLERDNLTDLLVFMQGNGFTLFDLTDLGHYPNSQVLYECYATFIPRALDFRKNLKWCTPEQEVETNERLRQRRAKAMSVIEGLH